MAGAAFAAAQLSTVGEPKTYTYRGGEGDIELNFCGHCGTHLYAYPKANSVVVVRINSLDDNNAIPPAKSIYSAQACVWDKLIGRESKRT